MEEEQLRNAHLKYKTYAHSTQRVVSVSQILPSNFLVPEGLGTFGAPVSPPDHPVGSPAAAAGDSPGTAVRHSDDTQALYGSARDSADGHANAPALSSSTERSGGGAAVLPAALAAGGSGVLRADGSSAAEPPRLHQVFSALAQKVAQVEQPPDALHRRSSSPVGDVTLQSTTDIVPQVSQCPLLWPSSSGRERPGPAVEWTLSLHVLHKFCPLCLILPCLCFPLCSCAGSGEGPVRSALERPHMQAGQQSRPVPINSTLCAPIQPPFAISR